MIAKPSRQWRWKELLRIVVNTIHAHPTLPKACMKRWKACSAPQSTLESMSKRPDWLKVRIPSGENFFEVRRILRSHQLNTICEDAMCPNIAECWGKHRTATFMILGDICTRACAFCAVTSGRPTEYDLLEPRGSRPRSPI